MTGIEFGTFIDFGENTSVAPLFGQEIDLACGRLGLRPPFREPDEFEKLSFKDAIEAKSLAIKISGITDLALRVGEMDRDVNLVIASKTGAVAVNSRDSDEIKALQQALSELDEGNLSVLCTTYVAQA